MVYYIRLSKMNQKTKKQLKKLEDTTAELIGSKEKLLQHLHLLKTHEVLSFNVTSDLLVLRKEYIIYHKLYGIPNRLEYDLGKLEEIRDSLSDTCI